MCIRDRPVATDFTLTGATVNVPGTEKKAQVGNLTWICHNPVSYTHLDVYKRQALYEEVVNIPFIVTLPGKKHAGTKLPQLISNGVDSVSYTHLDVYKRQPHHFTLLWK